MTFNFLHNLNETKKTWFIVTGCLFITLILGYFVIYPSICEIKTMSKEISQLKNELTQKSKNGDSKSSLELYKKYTKKLELINKSLLTKNRELEFITALENIATKRYLEQKINLGDYQLVEGQSFFQMPVQIFLQGDFKNELKYLQEVEKLSYYLDIEKINITKTQSEDSEVSTTNIFILANTIWQ